MGRSSYTRETFASAVDLAIERDVDAVLVTGDLFDHARVSDDVLEWAANQLDRLARPVVLLTGRSDSRDLLHGLSLGADGYLSKPVRVETLRAMLEKLLH